MAIDPAGQWLASLHRTEAAFWWLGGASPGRWRPRRAERRITSLAFTPDSRWLLSVSASGRGSRVAHVPGRRAPDPPAGRGNYRPVLALHPSGQQAVVGLSRGRLWSIPLAGGPPRALAGFSERSGIGAVAFGDGGRLLAAAPRIGPREEKVVRIFDLETGDARMFGPCRARVRARRAPLGLSFASAAASWLRLWARVSCRSISPLARSVLTKQPSGSFRLSMERRVGLALMKPETGKLCRAAHPVQPRLLVSPFCSPPIRAQPPSPSTPRKHVSTCSMDLNLVHGRGTFSMPSSSSRSKVEGRASQMAGWIALQFDPGDLPARQ